MATNSMTSYLQRPASIAPLVTFRIIFGALMIVSTVRFLLLGWVEDHYLQPGFHFKYYGFGWVTVLPAPGMYAVHLLLIIAAVCVMLGFYYRVASIALFLLFTYTELVDLTYYLNHYYFVSLVCLLLIMAPAHRHFSLDVVRRPSLRQTQVPRLWIVVFQAQLAIVYLYAGLAKINYDWLVEAMPLRIWLPAHDKLPLIGAMFRWDVTPYLFSWAGMFYDCTIVFFLLWHRTRPWAFVTVVIFHALTGILFQIGVFPLVMAGAALIFFSEAWHVRVQGRLRRVLGLEPMAPASTQATAGTSVPRMLQGFFIAYFVFQLLFPWRYLVYPGNLFWTEEGYRFSWRVMLMEKAGTATFYVKDTRTGREGAVVNSEFLNAHQEKQMAMQPDMILQYAHFLARYYEAKGVSSPAVRAEVYVTLNAQPSQPLIDPHRNLTVLEDGWQPKDWILPYTETK
jgi:uncharacterized membrane protein YphA (DoxX/SURF4 family)